MVQRELEKPSCAGVRNLLDLDFKRSMVNDTLHTLTDALRPMIPYVLFVLRLRLPAVSSPEQRLHVHGPKPQCQQAVPLNFYALAWISPMPLATLFVSRESATCIHSRTLLLMLVRESLSIVLLPAQGVHVGRGEGRINLLTKKKSDRVLFGTTGEALCLSFLVQGQILGRK